MSRKSVSLPLPGVVVREQSFYELPDQIPRPEWPGPTDSSTPTPQPASRQDPMPFVLIDLEDR